MSDAIEDQAADAIRLAATELVTNAVRHGGVEEEDGLVLIVDVDHGVVRVEVEQPTSATAARVVESPGITGGFGLVLVDAVSRRWGVTEGRPGRVWFEI